MSANNNHEDGAPPIARENSDEWLMNTLNYIDLPGILPGQQHLPAPPAVTPFDAGRVLQMKFT